MAIVVHYQQETLCHIPERHVPAFRALCESAGIAATYSPTKRALLLRKWLEGRRILLVREPLIAGIEPLARFCDQLVAHLEGVDADVDLAFAIPPARTPEYDLILSVAAGSQPPVRCTHAPRNPHAQNVAARIATQFEQNSGLGAVVTAERRSLFRPRNRARLALPEGVPAVSLEVPLIQGPHAEATYAQMALAVYQGILASFGARAPLLAHIEPEVWEPFIRHVVPRVFPHHGRTDTPEPSDTAQPPAPPAKPVEAEANATADAAPVTAAPPAAPPVMDEGEQPAAVISRIAADTACEPDEADEPAAAAKAGKAAGKEPPLPAEHLLIQANVTRTPTEQSPNFYLTVIQQGLHQVKQTPDYAPQDAAAPPSPQPDRPPQPPGATVTLFPPPIRRRVGEVLHEPAPTTPPVAPPTPEQTLSPSASGGCQTCGKVTWKPRPHP